MPPQKTTPTSKSHEIRFGGGLLRRGFWLYIWEVIPRTGSALYYVGRTGDSSTVNAQSPFNRMGQHLGFAKNSNMLRRHLEERSVQVERCELRLVALGPLEEESRAEGRIEHDERRDLVAAMEKALAEAMTASGYQVMNVVRSRKPLDTRRFTKVRAAFAMSFPNLMQGKAT